MNHKGESYMAGYCLLPSVSLPFSHFLSSQITTITVENFLLSFPMAHFYFFLTFSRSLHFLSFRVGGVNLLSLSKNFLSWLWSDSLTFWTHFLSIFGLKPKSRCLFVSYLCKICSPILLVMMLVGFYYIVCWFLVLVGDDFVWILD